ncbi:glycosyltransferase family 39 protein [Candidatus Woesearchaeota archaeon]|nr:glycosyltransferase family 39 protein [Candidatus Woesearchaeota archaeon]
MQKRSKALLLTAIAVVLFILLRLPMLDAFFFGDETAWPSLVEYQTREGPNFYQPYGQGNVGYWIDPPLTGILLTAWSFIFGFGTVQLRLFSLLFAVLNLIFVYLIGKKMFNQKVAVISMFLMAICYWNLFSSYIIDRDSSIITLAISMSVYFYLNRERNGTYKSLFMISAFAALAMFCKITSLFALLIVSAFLLFDSKLAKDFVKKRKISFENVKELLLKLAALFSVYVVAYVLFTQILSMLYPEFAKALFSETNPAEYLSFSTIFQGISRELVYIVLWGSPLLLVFGLLSLKSFSRKKLFLLTWILIPVAIYSISSYGGAIDRYLTVIVPPLVILAASFFDKISFSKKETAFAAVLSFLAFLLFNFLNKLPVQYIPHSIATYVKNAFSLQWGFIFPFYGVGGPNFMLSFIPIGFAVVLGVVLTSFAWFVLENKKFRNSAVLVLLAVMIGFQVLVINEFLFRTTYPDVNSAVDQITEIYNNELDESHKGKLYVNTLYSGFFFTLKNLDFSDVIFTNDCKNKDACWQELAKNMTENKGIGIFVDYPKVSDGDMKKKFFVDNCRPYRTIIDKEMEIAHIYLC